MSKSVSNAGYSVGILTKGDLYKRSRHQSENGILLKANWRKRYFILNDNKLTYYVNENSLKNPHGDLLLVDDSYVSQEPSLDNQQYVFKVTTPFDSMTMAAASEDERSHWIEAFEKAIDLIKMSLRGYMITHNETLADVFSTATIRKFFVFHDRTLYVHKDHEHTTTCQTSMRINYKTHCVMDEKTSTILVTDDKGRKIDMIFEQRNLREIKIWYKALQTKIASMKAEHVQGEIKTYKETAQLEGIIGLRVPGEDNRWEVKRCTLNNHDMVLMTVDSKGNALDISEIITIKDNAMVKESDMRPNAIEIISSERVLHICLKTKDEMNVWIKSLQDMSIADTNLVDGSIIQASKQLIASDIFYEVKFPERKEMGVAFSREGNWMMVNMSEFETTGIRPGSALTYFNQDNVILNEFQTTKLKFRNWQPPLCLTFRQAPQKFGYLQRKLNGTDGKSKWKKNYIELIDGKLCCKNTEEKTEEYIMQMPLTGAVVMQLTKEQVGKKFSFKVIHGNQSFTFRAETEEVMQDWVTIIYHAIDIANGGKQVIEYERERIAQDQHMKMSSNELEYATILAELRKAVTSEIIEEIQVILDRAVAVHLTGDEIDNAKQVLARLVMERDLHQRSVPAVNYQQESASSSDMTSSDQTSMNVPGRGYTLAGDRPSIEVSEMSSSDSTRMNEKNVKAIVYKERVSVTDMSSTESTANSTIGKSYSLNVKDMHISDMSSVEGTYMTAAGVKGYNVNRTSVNVSDMASIDSVTMATTGQAYTLVTTEEVTMNDTVTTDAATISGDGADYKQVNKVKHTSLSRNTGDSIAGKAYTATGYIATEEVEEYFEEEETDEPIEEVKEVIVSKWGPPASEADIVDFYRQYAHKGEDNVLYINAMRFCTLFRMITEERGNLYKEMLLFDRFSATAKIGVMHETDFVHGWLKLAEESGSDLYLCRIRYLLDREEDNMLF